MNKKGFTLVELLAVVAILGLLAAIISPIVKNLLDDSKESLSKQQKEMVITATKKYMVEHSELLPEYNSTLSIYISDLISDGVIENNKVINPKTKKELDGCVVISYSNEFNQYEYNYFERSSQVCDSNEMIAYKNVITGSYYETLKDAFNNLQNDSQNTIRVLRNVNDESEESPTVIEGKTAVLDLNGHTLTMDNSITNNGNLTVTGSGELTNSTDANITNTITGTFTKEGTSTISNSSNSLYIINNQGIAKFSEGNVIAGYRAINNQTNGRLVVSGTNISANDMAIYNAGTASSSSEPSVLISSGTITSSLKQGIQNASAGTVYMSGGVVTSNGANTYGIQNSSGGNVTITGGTINAAYRCIRNSSSSTLTISDGTFSTNGVSGNTYSAQALSLAGGTINVSGGTFNVNKGSSSSSIIVELENNATPNVTITGGTFTGDYGGIVVNGAGTLEISGTTSITAPNGGINNVRTGTVNITGGTITSSSANAVNNQSSGTMTISGGTIESKSANSLNNLGNMQISGGIIKQTGSNSAIRNNTSGTLSISGGTITSSGAAGISHGNGNLNITGGIITGKTYGIWIAGISTAIVNLGNKENAVDITTPKITATDGIGIQVVSEGIFNFYDGVITGTTNNAISGSVTGLPNGYSISRTNSNGKQTAILTSN